MFYVLLSHAALVALAYAVWKKRGLQWSSLDTASCVVLPFAVFLLWILIGALIPSDLWPNNVIQEMPKNLAVAVITLPPLIAFWTWFLWSGLKKQPDHG